MFVKHMNRRMNACMNEIKQNTSNRFLLGVDCFRLQPQTCQEITFYLFYSPEDSLGKEVSGALLSTAQFEPAFFKTLSGIDLDRSIHSLFSSATALIIHDVKQHFGMRARRMGSQSWLGTPLPTSPHEAATVLSERAPSKRMADPETTIRAHQGPRQLSRTETVDLDQKIPQKFLS